MNILFTIISLTEKKYKLGGYIISITLNHSHELLYIVRGHLYHHKKESLFYNRETITCVTWYKRIHKRKKTDLKIDRNIQLFFFFFLPQKLW
jgi:hypothetical protein